MIVQHISAFTDGPRGDYSNRQDVIAILEQFRCGDLGASLGANQKGDPTWHETSITRLPSTTRTPRRPIGRPPNITARATTPRDRSTRTLRSNTRRLRISTAIRPTPRASNRSSAKGDRLHA